MMPVEPTSVADALFSKETLWFECQWLVKCSNLQYNALISPFINRMQQNAESNNSTILPRGNIHIYIEFVEYLSEQGYNQLWALGL